MLSSISGQNDRWAQLGVYPRPPSLPSGQNGGSASTGSTAAPSGSANDTPAAGGTSGPLSDDMSFTLMGFNIESAAGQNNTTSDAASPDPASSTQDGSSPKSQLLTDVQSLMSDLTGTAGSPTGKSAASDTDTAAATDFGSTIRQGLQTVTSTPDTMASTSGSAPGGPTPGQPSRSNDISNTGTSAGGGTSGWTPNYSDGFQQQFALAAYSTTSTMSALDSSATASLANINA